MEKKTVRKTVLTVLALVLGVALLAGAGTYAYLYDSTNPVENGFNTNVVVVSLNETGVDANGIKQYEIIPGLTDNMDSSVSVYNTVDAYVYLLVTDNVSNGSKKLVDYEMVAGWTKLSESGNTAVYYREAGGLGEGYYSADEEKLFTDSTMTEQLRNVYTIITNDTVSYDAALVNEDMLDENGDLITGLALSFKSYAVQKEGFTPESGYDEVKE